ncbi:autotransporter beta-domain protein [Chlamydia ibidis]|uniref:Autotransporter beta-domain protein n=2 Tax=Chlamydia ibidis TaxID=1405396 RepID=S7J5A3_9CHLA|nr:autotransporter beta-domain protein [Chlamydia ibidis]EQM63086.1 autotransporter beta-domain protein [Chlamydia ibidis 10-1398/6]
MITLPTPDTSGETREHNIDLLSEPENTTKQLVEGQYGYQGEWIVNWAPITKTAGGTQGATLVWKQTGYKVNPERQGDIVPNTLWGCFSDVQSVQNLMHANLSTSRYRKGLWGAGLANLIYKQRTPKKQKFHHASGGYVVGLSGETRSENIFGGAFCELFTRDKNEIASRSNAHSYLGAVYYQYNTVSLPLRLHGQFTYCHTSNDMKTKMTEKYAPKGTSYPVLRGEWVNDCFGLEFGGSIKVPTRTLRVRTFLNIQAIYAHQEDFNEDSIAYGRKFASSDLVNLSLPIGVHISRLKGKNDFHVSVAYSPDLVRHNPHSDVYLLSTPLGANWRSCGTNLARQGLLVRCGNHRAYTPHFSIFGNFTYELRGSSRTCSGNLGSMLRF